MLAFDIDSPVPNFIPCNINRVAIERKAIWLQPVDAIWFPLRDILLFECFPIIAKKRVGQIHHLTPASSKFD
jgi:hypothetical protein